MCGTLCLNEWCTVAYQHHHRRHSRPCRDSPVGGIHSLPQRINVRHLELSPAIPTSNPAQHLADLVAQLVASPGLLITRAVHVTIDGKLASRRRTVQLHLDVADSPGVMLLIGFLPPRRRVNGQLADLCRSLQPKVKKEERGLVGKSERGRRLLARCRSALELDVDVPGAVEEGENLLT